MKKTTILFVMMLAVSLDAHAELWVNHDSGSIKQTYSGDCYKAGFCGLNNSNLEAGWIEVSAEQYENAKNKYYKVDSGAVVEMTVPEKAALDQAELDEQTAAMTAARNAVIDEAISKVDSPDDATSLLIQVVGFELANEIREMKKGSPRASRTDEKIKQDMKAYLETLKL